LEIPNLLIRRHFSNYQITKLQISPMNAVLIVDKPSGLTSHDVVNRMRRILQQRSIGHLGTLDPLATGVLPLVTGSFTRLAQFYTNSDKSYEGVIRFGFATNTYDADGDPLEAPVASVGTEGSHVGKIENHVGTAALGGPTTALNPGHPNSDALNQYVLNPHALTSDALTLATLQKLSTDFVGVIQQVPPPFSAKKIHGVPAYKLARKNREVSLAPAEVEIKEFAITALDAGCATFRARVSSGTYMRSVAHEMGQRLGCGAHLASLRRTAVAEFDISQARTLEEIALQVNARKHAEENRGQTERSPISQAMHENQGVPHVSPSLRDVGTPTGETAHLELASLFIHPRQLLPQFPSITADDATAARIRHGRPVNLPDLSRAPHVKVFADQSTLIAIATRVAGTLFRPKIVFPLGPGD
jgi:tRNA pseudouridine55 synthase